MDNFISSNQITDELPTRSFTIFVDPFPLKADPEPKEIRYRVVSLNPYFINTIGDKSIIVDVFRGAVAAPSSAGTRVTAEYIQMVNAICDAIKSHYKLLE